LEMVYGLCACGELRRAQPLKFSPPFVIMFYARIFHFLDVL
jgi:hypothetical protein